MSDWINDILQGDARETLATLPASSVHMAMTSPPYWNLRDYGTEGQLGLEETPEAYIEHIAAVMDELKRVLRLDGSLWLNLGDTYDDKDLQQIPARVALALQDRGWTLRNRVTWAKPNPMPNSVTDRLNTTTEAVFHLTPAKRYWYDLDAIREAHKEVSKEHIKSGLHQNHPEDSGVAIAKTDTDEMGERFCNPAGKNPGDVFEVTTKPFPDAHFAVYPPELCEKPIKASCPPKVCVDCGTPYEREVERSTPSVDEMAEKYSHRNTSKTDIKRSDGDYAAGKMRGQEWNEWKKNNPDEFKGWRQLCDCDTDATEPGITLDPFAGAGTTCLVAKRLGRRFVGIELNPEYVAMAQSRVGVTVDDPDRLTDDEQATLAGVNE